MGNRWSQNLLSESKTATGCGEIAALEALGKETFENLDFLRPQRFIT